VRRTIRNGHDIGRRTVPAHRARHARAIGSASGGDGGGHHGGRTRLERRGEAAADRVDRLALRRVGAGMKTFAVINPSSSGGKTGRDVETIARRLADVTGPLTVVMTKGPMDATRLTAHALQQGYERVVAVGGDGTINEVVNGFFLNGSAINPEAELALLNLGTGGDFRKTFDIDAGFDASLARIAEGRPRRIDVGRLSFVSSDGKTGSRHFANIASFGMSGDVVDRVNRATT